MTRFLVVSGRDYFTNIADCCSFELEDALVDSLGADLCCVDDKGITSGACGGAYDVLFIVANDFKKLAETEKMAEAAGLTAQIRCAYVFGAYLHTVHHNSLLRKVWSRYRAISKMDCIFAGIEENIDPLSQELGVPFHYSPMAVNVLKIGATVCDRSIDVNGFGRQDKAIHNLLADTFNRPDSAHFYYHTNALKSVAVNDWVRHRDMFWHVLRRSKLSLAFDVLYCNPNQRAKLSYVGPRWFESLGAGNVVVGQAPRCANVKDILDWDDAAIDLPEDAEAAVGEIIGLLKTPDRLREISRVNLVNMNRKHDWRYRIATMLQVMGLALPAVLEDQLALLEKRADTF